MNAARGFAARNETLKFRIRVAPASIKFGASAAIFPYSGEINNKAMADAGKKRRPALRDTGRRPTN